MAESIGATLGHTACNPDKRRFSTARARQSLLRITAAQAFALPVTPLSQVSERLETGSFASPPLRVGLPLNLLRVDRSARIGAICL